MGELYKWLMKYFGGGGTTAATPVLTAEEQAKPWLVPQTTDQGFQPKPTFRDQGFDRGGGGDVNPALRADLPPASIIPANPSPDEQALIDALALKRRNQGLVRDIRSVGLTREPVPR